MVIVHQLTAPQKECISVIEIGDYFIYNKLYQSVHGSSYFRADDFKQWIINAKGWLHMQTVGWNDIFA